MARLFDMSALPALWKLNAAGNPVVVALLRGELNGVFEPVPCKLHDCAYLIPLVLLGGFVCDLDGQPIDVMEVFATALYPNERFIGPFIAAVNARVAERMLSLRRWPVAA